MSDLNAFLVAWTGAGITMLGVHSALRRWWG